MPGTTYPPPPKPLREVLDGKAMLALVQDWSGGSRGAVRRLREQEAGRKLPMVVETGTAAIANDACSRWCHVSAGCAVKLCCEHQSINNAFQHLVQGSKSVPSWRQTM